jgi:hypothetical protein
MEGIDYVERQFAKDKGEGRWRHHPVILTIYVTPYEK